MKKSFILSLIICLSAVVLFNSCSGCVKKATKKVAETGLSAVEGVSEAVDEHGSRVGEKATDALGKVAEGVGRSLDRQLDEHAEKVASVVGRTLVQTVEGLDKGASAQYYDEIPYNHDFCSGVSLDYFAKIKSKSVIDAYFIVIEKGTYKCKFEFSNNDGKVFLTKETDIEKPADARKYSLVSFALNPEEETQFANLSNVKISVTKK